MSKKGLNMAQRYYGRQRSYGNIKADIEDIVAVSEKRMLALMRQSLQDVIENAQTPTGKGGRMRVDTGFLRASGRASLTGMPSGPVRGEPDQKYSYSDESAVIAILGQMKLGQTLHFGWTANYAKYRELFDGFLEGALMHWARIVAFNTDTIRQRIKQ
jgi:peptidoglycan hydrolase-like protein with peptidoglycan-binding domain